MAEIATTSEHFMPSSNSPGIKDYPQCERIISNIVAERASQLPEHQVLQFNEQVINYRQLNERTDAAAQGFTALGVCSESNVAIMLPNCAEHIYSWFGLNRIGAVDVPINTAQRGSGLQYQIDYADAMGLVVHRDYLEAVDGIIDRLPKLKFAVIVGELEESAGLPKWEGIEVLDYQTFSAAAGDAKFCSGSFKSTSSILFTSGTTGRSKGVMISNHYWYQASMSAVKFCKITHEDVLYTAMPLFHSAARGMIVLPAILANGKAILVERFSASQMFDDLKRWKCTVASYIGGMISILMKQPPKPDDADNPVRLMFGAAAPVQIWDEFQQRFNVKLLELYGATECLFNLVNPYDEPRPGSCGKPINGYRVKLVDDNDVEVPVGEVGEIIVQPESMYLGTSGYYKMPEETVNLTRNFWYHTGDLGRMDEDGYFYFADRKKQAIRRRGENISSFEVEGVINEHKSVLECCVVGVPCELGEEDVKAVVVLKDGHQMDCPELIEWCKARMAYFCVPRYIEFRQSLPKTPSDRVEKYKLKDEGVTEQCWDVEKSGITVRPSRV